MIETSNYEYHLTPLGNIVRGKIEDFTMSIGVISRHRDFWANHHLEGIPEPFLLEIGSLMNSDVVSDTNVDIFQVYSNFLRMVQTARWIHGITSIMSMGHAEAIAQRVEDAIPVDLIVSLDVVGKLRQEPYIDRIRSLSPYSNFRVFVIQGPLKIGLTVTDAWLSLGLFRKDSITYDTTTDLFSSDSRAIGWGERLFSYYVGRSELVRF